MMRKARRSLVRLVTIAAVAIPGALSAQEAPAAPQELTPEVQAWLAELQQLHVQLTELQEKALQDPQLAAQRDSLGAHIRAEMESIDPELPAKMSRIPQMEAEAAAAEAQNDETKLAALRTEAQQIEQQFLSAQQQALQKPELAAELSAFQSALEARILQADPEAPKLMARFQELEEKLAKAAQ